MSGEKRARVIVSEYKINMESFPKYEIVCGGGASSKLSMHNVDTSYTQQLELGCVNTKSNIIFAHYDGKLYVGTNTYNPGSFDANGECIERHTGGITVDSLIDLFALKASSVLKITPREGWNAGFKLLETPGGHSDALHFRVFFTSPYAETQAATFQDEFIMHAFSVGGY